MAWSPFFVSFLDLSKKPYPLLPLIRIQLDTWENMQAKWTITWTILVCLAFMFKAFFFVPNLDLVPDRDLDPEFDPDPDPDLGYQFLSLS